MQPEGGGARAGGGGEVLLGCSDPGTSPDHPTWPLRNALLLAARAVGLRRLRVVCARTRGGRPSPAASLLLDVCLPEVPPGAPPLAPLHRMLRKL